MAGGPTYVNSPLHQTSLPCGRQQLLRHVRQQTLKKRNQNKCLLHALLHALKQNAYTP